MTAFRDKPLVSKIRYVIIILALSFILMIALISIIYYLNEAEVTIPEDGRLLTERIAPALDRELYDISENFIYLFSTDDFKDDLYHACLGDLSATELSIRLQEELGLFQRSSYLIDTALFLCPDRRQAVTLWGQSLKKAYNPLSSLDFKEIDGVTFLPLRPSPLEWQEDVIPVVFPVRYNYGADIAKGEPRGSAFVVAYINIIRLRALLEGDERHELVLSRDGKALTGSPGAKDLAYETELPLTGLTLSDYVDKDKVLAEALDLLWKTSLVVLLLAFFLLFFLGYLLTEYVTRPVRKLEKAVREIEAQNYGYDAGIAANDELGALSRSIARMGHTIEEQIGRIEKEKSEKYQMEIRLLSEQLKPHFIYNTLECIQQEIKRGRTESALEMVREFSLYLRTALNYGKDTITVNEEIRHDLSYVRIMNHRFSTAIRLSHWVDEGLEEVLIPKSLLQPFVENSIKHGFPETVSSPEIELSFQRSGSRLLITIADNGAGFDEEEMTRIITTDFGDGHVGLRNSYRRLKAMHPEIDMPISVSSIPFYRSEVRLTLPL